MQYTAPPKTGADFWRSEDSYTAPDAASADFNTNAPWTPNEVTTEFWIESANVNNVTETSGEISAVTDLSPNANNGSQGTAAYQPNTSANWSGYHQGIYNDGGDAISHGDVLDTVFAGTDPAYSVFAVHQNDAATTRSTYLTKLGDSSHGLNARQFLMGTASGRDRMMHTIYYQVGSGGFARIVENTTNVGTGVNLHALTFDNSITTNDGADAVNFYLNGTSQTSTVTYSGGAISSTVPSAEAHLTVGGCYGTSGPVVYTSSSTTGEVIVIDGVVDTTTRQRIEGYLAWKWGIEDQLAGGHPYENEPPLLGERVLKEDTFVLLLEDGGGMGLESLDSGPAGDITGTAAITLGELTLSATGVNDAGIVGDAAITLDDLTLSSAGTVSLSGDAAITLDELLVTSFGLSPPAISVQPTDITTIIEYRDATFSITATGGGTLTYQWYEVTNGILPGQTTDTLTFPAQLTDEGNQYYCVVTNEAGSVQSDNATLIEVVDANHPDPGTAPVFDSEVTAPADVSSPLGQPVTLSVTITPVISQAPYSISWYNSVDGFYTNTATSTSLTLTPPVEYHLSEWWVVVQDSQGYYAQSGTGNMAIVPAQLELAWSIEDATQDTTVIVYQSIAWSLYDAKTDEKENNFTCPVRTHRGISIEDGRTYWIPFYDLSARCHRGPLVNDAYNRYYWTQDGQDAKYDTFQNLEWNQYTEGYDLGVPPPAKVPAVAAAQITSNDDIFVTRAYVYTYVTIYGEEGPPSLPTVADGKNGGIWTISNLLSAPEDGKRRQITTKNIYRTVPSQTGTAEYHYVASVGINTPLYYDDALDEEVAENFIMESTNWFPPPEKLSGLTAHPNGFFVGFVGRDIYFSEPYRPHAWNPEYTLSTLGEIIGLGVFGTTVVVCTNSFPYAVTGIHPEAMVLTQHDTAEPCLARYGIVSMPFGVYYPGPNGLMLASSQGFVNATQQLMTKEEWQTRYNLKAFDAARYQSQYVAFYNSVQGIMFAPDEPMAALVDLDLSTGNYEPDQIDSIFTDEYSGKTFMLDDCKMYEWNPVSGAPLEFDWTSMEFDAYDPVNFGACRIIWYSDYTPPTEEEIWAWRVFNTARIAAADLHPMNFNVLNGVEEITPLTYDLTPIDAYPEIDQTVVQEYLDNFVQKKQTFQAGPLIEVTQPGEKWPNTPYVIMQLIANEQIVYTREIPHTEMFRLPAGFKATRFRIRLRSNINIQSVKLAETGKELSAF